MSSISDRRAALDAAAEQLARKTADLDRAEQFDAVIPAVDRFPDGTVIRIQRRFGSGTTAYTFLVLKAGDAWFPTGSRFGSVWDYGYLRDFILGNTRGGMCADAVDVAAVWRPIGDAVKDLPAPADPDTGEVSQDRLIHMLAVVTGRTVDQVVASLAAADKATEPVKSGRYEYNPQDDRTGGFYPAKDN